MEIIPEDNKVFEDSFSEYSIDSANPLDNLNFQDKNS